MDVLKQYVIIVFLFVLAFSPLYGAIFLTPKVSRVYYQTSSYIDDYPYEAQHFDTWKGYPE